jgi:hypothetical protein
MGEGGMMEILVIILTVLVAALAVGVGVLAATVLRRRPSEDAPRSLTRRIRLSGGQWADVRTRVTQAMAAVLIGQVPEEASSPDDLNAAVRTAMIQAVIVEGVTEWSYGDVDLDTLTHEVPVTDQNRLGEVLVKVVQDSSWWSSVLVLGDDDGAG